MLVKEDFFEELKTLSGKEKQEIVIVSPFLSVATLEELMSGASVPPESLTLVTRDDPFDYACGYNDTAAWEAVWKRRGRVLLCPKLHAKYYRFGSAVFMGSGNLTDAGMGRGGRPNVELMTRVPFDDQARLFEKELAARSVELDPEDPDIRAFKLRIESMKEEARELLSLRKHSVSADGSILFERSRLVPTGGSAPVPISGLIPESVPTSETASSSAYPSIPEVLALMGELERAGCVLLKETKKISSYRTPGGRVFVILWVSKGIQREELRSDVSVVFDPDVVTFDGVASVTGGIPGKLYTNSNMKFLPKKPGTAQGYYGVQVNLPDRSELVSVLARYDGIGR